MIEATKVQINLLINKSENFSPTSPLLLTYTHNIPTIYPQYTYPLPTLKVKNTTKIAILRKIYYKNPIY